MRILTFTLMAVLTACGVDPDGTVFDIDADIDATDDRVERMRTPIGSGNQDTGTIVNTGGNAGGVTGGTTGMGGATGTGGAADGGGAGTAVGGSPVTGGVVGTGGTPATGGNGGSANTGGSPVTTLPPPRDTWPAPTKPRRNGIGCFTDTDCFQGYANGYLRSFCVNNVCSACAAGDTSCTANICLEGPMRGVPCSTVGGGVTQCSYCPDTPDVTWADHITCPNGKFGTAVTCGARL